MNCVKCGRKIFYSWCDDCNLKTTEQVLQIAAANPNWIYLGSGRHREVWRLPSGNVLKIPKGMTGEAANVEESKMWINRFNLEDCHSDWKLARCRLIPGTFILVMEYLRPHKMCYDELPYWCQLVDGGQVGFNRKGELVAYDYAW